MMLFFVFLCYTMIIVNNPMNYLEAKLLPLIEGIKPKQSESYTLSALGLERHLSQSILLRSERE